MSDVLERPSGARTTSQTGTTNQTATTNEQ